MRSALNSIVLLAATVIGGFFAVPACGSDEDGASGGSAGRGNAGGRGGAGGGALGKGGTSGALGSSGANAGGTAGTSSGGGGGTAGGNAGSSGTAGTDSGSDAGGSAGTNGSGGTSGAAGTNVDGSAGVAGSAGAGGGDASACVGDWRAGDYPPDITQPTYLQISNVAGQQGLTREYKVHLPPSYNCAVPTPVVFCLHGLSQTPTMFCVNGSGYPGGAGFHTKSNEAGFILVMPLGYGNSWNGAGCCGNAGAMGLDDVALMRALLKEVQTHANVDAKRVYATGLSNGGYMSYRLACEAADIFTAVAPGAGGLQASFQTSCSPSRPIAVLDIHGTMDTYVPYSLQQPSLARIASRNGCATTTAPATQPTSGGDTTCISYNGCPTGVAVTGCTIQGGGHAWFGDPSCGTGAGAGGCVFVGANSNHMVNTTAVWDFFKRFSR